MWLILLYRKMSLFLIFQSGYVVQASFVTDTAIIFKILKKISDWFMFQNFYLQNTKYRDLIFNSSNSYVARKHFVTWRINLIHYILDKCIPELKELFFFSYFFKKISHNFFSRIFIKVYMGMASLKRRMKTRFVILFSFF